MFNKRAQPVHSRPAAGLHARRTSLSAESINNSRETEILENANRSHVFFQTLSTSPSVSRSFLPLLPCPSINCLQGERERERERDSLFGGSLDNADRRCPIPLLPPPRTHGGGRRCENVKGEFSGRPEPAEDRERRGESVSNGHFASRDDAWPVI